MKIMHTDNFGGDYPDERFVEGLPQMNTEEAEVLCVVINTVMHQKFGATGAPRHYRVVPDDYTLSPGFEP